ncbi:MFS general substrate transporter [Auricularia subglabra TFB-10046 SS5]|nr:MFS general substrate transporter [Auricularia subglabra TFB-10046 SS5]
MSRAPSDDPAQAESYQLPVLSVDMDNQRPAPVDVTRKDAVSEEDDALVQTAAQLRIERIRFATLLFSFFLAGWNDGPTGPLLPAIKRHYHVGFAAVSSLFIVTFTGAGVGAFSIFYVLERFGFGKVLVCGAVLQAIAYAVQSAAPPFPAFVFVGFLNGVGVAFQTSAGNGFVASLKRNGARKMGILHAVYGFGAFVSPFVATQFSSMKHWSLFYLTSTGLALCVAIALSAIFRFKRQETLLRETNSEIHKTKAATAEPVIGGTMRQILALPLVHYLALYICVYVGVEITLGGWIVTFVINERGGGPDAGYISSGFFGGLTVGRVLLLPVNAWLGERRVIFLYAILTIALDIVIWRVRSLVGDAVAVSIIGILFGPMYPIVMHQAGLIIPSRLLAGAVGYISGFGIVGGGVVPFVTGALANRFEVRVMPIVVLVMTSLLALLWGLAVSEHRKVHTN